MLRHPDLLTRVFPLRSFLLAVCALEILIALAPQAQSRDKKDYGTGLVVNIPAPEAEVVQAVEDVVQDGIIRGSKEYNKDEYISGAAAASDSRLFPAWTAGGKVFYKVRLHALDPRNFKDSGDMGTLAVRYVVMGQSDQTTVLRIDAVFVEEFRRTAHASNGSVESGEYKDVHDRIEAIELTKRQTGDLEKEKEEATQKPIAATVSEQTPATAAQSTEENPPAQTAGTIRPAENLEQRLQQLRRQVERLVKAPGAPLKSAPFHTATNLQSLPAGTEVLIVLSTTYWYGVETHDGQHGWMLRDELEELP